MNLADPELVELPDDSPLPKYFQIRSILGDRLAQMAPGDPIPPERDLATAFNVSRTTIRQAIQELVSEGRLERQQGRGTFVARPKLRQALQLSSYTEDMKARGLAPSSRLLRLSRTAAEGGVATALAVPLGHPLLRVERLRLANGEPMATETVHLDANRFSWVKDELTDRSSLYELLNSRGVELVFAQQTIEASLATDEELALLEAHPNQPMLLMTRVSFDAAERPIEHVRSLYRGDRYRLQTPLLPPTAPLTSPAT
jgi:GntR family transcriptional regulator